MLPQLLPVTRALMMACAAAFALQHILPGSFERWLALWPLTSGLFMPWQVLTYGILHADMFHILLNMLALWMFGSDLERLWGPKRYLHLIVASVLTAAAVQLLWSWMTGSSSPTVGISGAVFGLLLGFGMMFPNRMVMLLIPPIPMKAKYFVMVFAAIELAFGLGSRDGIAHFAHLGGMLGAWMLILSWRGRGPFARRR